MSIDDIERLVRRLENADIRAFEFTDATTSLTLRYAGKPAEPGQRDVASAGVAEATPADGAGAKTIRAGAIGILRLRHPAAAQDVDPVFPRAVRAGEIVAYLDAGSCLRPVVMEQEGTIGAALVAEGTVVGYGTPLFALL